MALPKLAEMLVHKFLHVFRESRMNRLAKDEGRSLPFLDHSVDESFLYHKRIVARQFTSTSPVEKKTIKNRHQNS